MTQQPKDPQNTVDFASYKLIRDLNAELDTLIKNQRDYTEQMGEIRLYLESRPQPQWAVEQALIVALQTLQRKGASSQTILTMVNTILHPPAR